VSCPFYGDGYGFVPPEGDPRKPWNVLESAGETETQQERPVMGAAGQEWERNLLSGAQRRRDQVYITNTIKCQPPKFARPHQWAGAIKQCRRYLEKESLSAGSGPSAVILYGSKALHTWLGSALSSRGGEPAITEWRGSLLRQHEWFGGIGSHVGISKGSGAPEFVSPITFASDPVIMPTLHPSYLIRGQWSERLNLSNDIRRALSAFPRRFPLLESHVPVLGLPSWMTVLDIETAGEEYGDISLVGILTGLGGVHQYRAIERDRYQIQRYLSSRTFKVGHNLPYDTHNLIRKGFSIRGPFWDTISAAKLEEPDLDADLACVTSRCQSDYFQWKGLPDSRLLQRIFRAVWPAYFTPLDSSDVPPDWWAIYNQVDLYQTARNLVVLMQRLARPAAPGLPSRLDLFYRAYVPMAPRLIAMTQHGMRPIIPKFEATAARLLDELAQIAAESLDVIEPMWNMKANWAREFVLQHASLPACPAHSTYDGIRKPGNRKCKICLQLYASIQDGAREELSEARAEVKRNDKGFKLSSPDHWRWLIYEHLELPVKERTDPTPAHPMGLPTLDDDVIRLMMLRCRDEGKEIEAAVLQWRLDYSNKSHMYDNFVEPILPVKPALVGEAVDQDGIVRPAYNTYRTSIGRLSSGGSEEEGGK